MEIRFKPTEDDGLNAMRASSTPSWAMFLFVLLLALLFLVGIYLINHDLPVAGWLWLALSAVIGIAVYEVPRIQVRRSLRKSPSAQGEIVRVLDGEGTVTTFPTGESRLNWRAYTKYKETGSNFSTVRLAISVYVDSEKGDDAARDRRIARRVEGSNYSVVSR
jgi:hypothetical protein